MAVRLFEVRAKEGHAATILALAEEAAAEDVSIGPVEADGRQTVRILCAPGARQSLLDGLQRIIGTSEDYRINILRVEATLPKPSEPSDEEENRRRHERALASREELYNSIARGAVIDTNFVLLVIFSTIVAAIGLLENSVAVVIGAMVIAPLLGPNLAFALGVAIGDRPLMGTALLSNAVGLCLSVALAALAGLFVVPDMVSDEICARMSVGWAGLALALASGAAAALSLTGGLSSTLVGVMVAVALLPPAATVGLRFGAGDFDGAYGASLLLAVNIVSVNIAAQAVFYAQGVRPRTWLEAHSSRNARILNAVILAGLFMALLAILFARPPGPPTADHVCVVGRNTLQMNE